MGRGETSPAGSTNAWKNMDAEVRGALGAYVAGLADFFARDLVGVYLYGSVAHDAFVPAVSDVDVAVLHRLDLDDARKRRLEKLHTKREGRRPGIGRLDVNFVPVRLAGERGDESLPYLRDGRFRRTGGGDVNLVTWRALRDRGVVVRGDPVVGVVPRVAREGLVEEMRQNLAFLRRRMPAYATSGTRDTVFGVLSLCRVLHTLRTGELIGKAAGARWALDNTASRWHPMVRQAMSRYEGNEFSGRDGLLADRATAFADCMAETLR